MSEFRPNTLYYGDNLDVLRDFPSECVDLVYLDPPFNSNRSYNVLFRETKGAEAEAQIEAFEDSWHWTQHTSETFDEVASRGDDVGRLLGAFVEALGHNDVTAYLTMMAPRLVELRRVMKPTASIYLHCDPTASHYLKVLMDAVFGPTCFRSEVIWKRSSAHSGSKRWSPVHDTLLFYGKGDQHVWNPIHSPLPQETIDAWYNNIEPETKRRFNRADLTAAGRRSGSSGMPWREIDPTTKGRHWAIPRFVRVSSATLILRTLLMRLIRPGVFFGLKQPVEYQC
jgi:site-specific DNA-methyltransferase (adenine-specific)